MRSEFGRQVQFSNGETQILDSILCSNTNDDKYRQRNPVVTCVDTTPHMSEAEINTERVHTKHASMRHSEGGWPKDVDVTEQGDAQRFRKKVEKDPNYQSAIVSLGAIVTRCMLQNNTVNAYEELFRNNETDHKSEPPSAKGLAVFRDPCRLTSSVERSATSIHWHPDGNGKVAVSYSIAIFQDERLIRKQKKDTASSESLNEESVTLSTSSYIWDVNNPNEPEIELLSPSPLCCLRYNSKNTDTLVGGCYNGLIVYYDLRKPNAAPGKCMPAATSLIEHSHHDPVYDVFWISSKAGYHCASISTDSRMMWWDTRALEQGPTDVIQVRENNKENEPIVLGGCSMEYSSEAGPTKYLVGTEQGQVASINLRNRKMNDGLFLFDNGAGRHHGPIHSIQRNPIHTKFFMTVGDWTARIWTEDIKMPILCTKYHSSYLTSGCWSTTRPGVFFVTRKDGSVDVWDYFYKQNEAVYSHKIGDVPLSSIAVHSGGKLAAIGDVNGTVSLIELCDSLAMPQTKEKKIVSEIFERETKREKNLDAREKELRRARAQQQERMKNDDLSKLEHKSEQIIQEMLKEIDEEFQALTSSKDEPCDDGSSKS